MKTSDDLTSAFDIVRTYDPATYQLMHDSKWWVSTSPWEGAWFMSTAYQAANMALGATGGYPNGPTWINAILIRNAAEENHTPTDVLTAVTLVHEFAHVGNTEGESVTTELPAYGAQLAFIHRLPARYQSALCKLYDESMHDMREYNAQQFTRNL